MALTTYKRGDFYWVRGSVRGRPVRRSLDTRNREVASIRAAELELGLDRGLEPVTWPKFQSGFLANYSGGTRHNFETLFRHLDKYFAGTNRPQPSLHDITLADLEAYLAARSIGSNTKRREIEHLRRIWAYALDHDMVRSNVARKLKVPAEIPAETQPFSDDELRRLELAIDQLEDFPELAGRLDQARAELRAKQLVLAQTGIRGSDLVQLRPEHIVDGHLVLRTQKRKTQVRIPLSGPVQKALANIEPSRAGFFFWTGEGNWKIARANLHRSFQRLGRRAGVPNCHPHRFRDTFSVNLLLAGADIRIVSKLLGHSSLRTTEKHYAPWVQGFQDQAAAAIAAVERRHAANRPRRPANKKGSR